MFEKNFEITTTTSLQEIEEISCCILQNAALSKMGFHLGIALGRLERSLKSPFLHERDLEELTVVVNQLKVCSEVYLKLLKD